MKQLLLQSAALLAFASACPAATIIAKWTFENSDPAGAGPFLLQTGSGSAMSNTGGTFAFTSGNGSARAWSSNGWAAGEYFQFMVSSVGFEDIQVSYAGYSSGTGPGMFDFQYSTDGSAFTNFATPGQATATWAVHPFDLSALSGLDNATSLFFRVTANGTTSAGGGTIGTSGTFRIDDFTVSGEPIRTASVPEGGSSLGILSLAVAGLLGFRRTLRT